MSRIIRVHTCHWNSDSVCGACAAEHQARMEANRRILEARGFLTLAVKQGWMTEAELTEDWLRLIGEAIAFGRHSHGDDAQRDDNADSKFTSSEGIRGSGVVSDHAWFRYIEIGDADRG